MVKYQVEEQFANLKGRLAYKEKKTSELGFTSITENFEDKIAKELVAIDQKPKNI